MSQCEGDLTNDLRSSSSQGQISGFNVPDFPQFSEDYFKVDIVKPNSQTDGMEKLIYLHIASLPIEDEDAELANDWYVLERGSDGGVVLLPAFEGIKPLNHPNTALRHTTCQVIGSCIYVIGGCNAIGEQCLDNYHVSNPGSNKIRRLDTRNLSGGWKTYATLPFNTCETRSTVINDQQLYFFGGHPQTKYFDIDEAKQLWGYALNLSDDDESFLSSS